MTVRTVHGPAWRTLLCCVALGLVVCGAPTVHARGLGTEIKKLFQKSGATHTSPGERLGFAAPTEPGPMSLDQAVATARALYPKGDIVSAETQHGDGGAIHVVKVLRANGKIKVIRFDAATGAQLD